MPPGSSCTNPLLPALALRLERNARALELRRGRWWLGGLPIEPSLWRGRMRQAAGAGGRVVLEELLAQVQGRPHCERCAFLAFAFDAAAALEELRALEGGGLVLDGRAWADLGGAAGHYAVALRVSGADAVTLVDDDAPPGWVRPLLRALGVRVLTGDVRAVAVPDAEAALLLHVPIPAADIRSVAAVSPALRTVLVDRKGPRVRTYPMPPRWRARPLAVPSLHGDLIHAVLGDARPAADPRRWWQRG